MNGTSAMLPQVKRPKVFDIAGTRVSEDEILATIRAGKTAFFTPEIREAFAPELAAREQRSRAAHSAQQTHEPAPPQQQRSAAPPARPVQRASGSDPTPRERQIIEVIGRVMREQFAKRDRRIDALEAERAKTLADAYCGTHEAGKQYGRGQVVTDRGSLWLCMTDTAQRPGDTPDWRLIVKAGRDAR